MTRDGSRRSREATTLGDALSPMARDQLHRLRDTLEKQAKQAFASQLAEGTPPWRQAPNPATLPNPPSGKNAPGSVPGAPVLKAHQQHIRGGKTVPMEPDARRMSQAGPEPEKPAFQYWPFPAEATVRERPPPSISDTDKSDFRDVLLAGSDMSTADGEDLHLVLGLDFGTSSTKVIVRLPYEAGQPTIAIPAPVPCRSENAPYLWQTVLWLQQEGTFLPWPTPGATVLNSLKQGLIQGRSELAISDSVANGEVSRAQAGVAYLTFVIRYVRGWLLRNRPNLFRGRRPVWFLNLGMPAASYDDPILTRPYRRVGAAALQLAKIDNPVTVEVSRRFLHDPLVVDAGTSEAAAEALGVAVLPETAAEMTGFSKSTQSVPGLYLLVDVGAMTLDACMFRLNQDTNANQRYAFMAAEVRPLGVDSFHWFLSEGKTEPEFVGQCDYALHSVIWETKARRDPNAANWKPGNDIPVFIAGGGAANALHRDIVASIGPWLERHVSNEGIRLLELPVPSAIDLPEKLHDFGRMTVAWGLSYPPTEIGRIEPMRAIEDLPPRIARDFSQRFVSPDQV